MVNTGELQHPLVHTDDCYDDDDDNDRKDNEEDDFCCCCCFQLYSNMLLVMRMMVMMMKMMIFVIVVTSNCILTCCWCSCGDLHVPLTAPEPEDEDEDDEEADDFAVVVVSNYRYSSSSAFPAIALGFTILGEIFVYLLLLIRQMEIPVSPMKVAVHRRSLRLPYSLRATGVWSGQIPFLSGS